MSNYPPEVPAEIRDFAERSLEQARKAFEGFLAVTQRAASVAPAPAGAKTISTQILSYTEQNVNAAFEFASKLVKAKDPQEIIALQSEYVRSQLAKLQSQAEELGVVIRKSIAPDAS